MEKKKRINFIRLTERLREENYKAKYCSQLLY